MNDVRINANELRTWIKTNFVSQVAPKSFAGNMVQSIIEKIDEMEAEARSINTAPTFSYENASSGNPVEVDIKEFVSGDLLPIEPAIEETRGLRAETSIINDTVGLEKTEEEIKRDAQKWVKHRRRR